MYDHAFIFTDDLTAPIGSEVPFSGNGKNDGGLLQAGPADGVGRIVSFSPRHDLTLSEMDLSDIRRIVDLWAEQYAELAPRYRWVQIYENKGALAGSSHPHPHGQIRAESFLPSEPAKEDVQQARYFAEHKRSLLSDYLEEELKTGERIVEVNEHWAVLAPWWSARPFELLLIPRRAVQSLPELKSAERDALADILKKTLTRYDNLFETFFPYSMGWHGRPGGENSGKEDFSHWQLHAHFYPPILQESATDRPSAGYAMLTEARSHITAEQTAERLRGCSTLHWRQRLNSAVKNGQGPLTEIMVCDAFRRRFKSDPGLLARTPGCVSLIGGHTDYNGGFILPVTTDRAVMMAARRRNDDTVRVYSVDYDEECRLDLKKKSKKSQSPWFECIKGCAAVLKEAGYALCGYDAILRGNIPQEAGLAVSAALEVTVLLAFAEAAGFELSKTETAKLARHAETLWLGVQGNVINQTVCALGEADSAMLLDCRDLDYEFCDLPENVVVAILNTATRRAFADSAREERRKECETACRAMGVSLLRNATQEMLDQHRQDMSDVAYRRARHILGENLRVHAAAAALRRGASDMFGKLMNESHFSLQYDYEVSSYELDAVTTIARRHPACLGACMTGEGFGGNAVALLHTGSEDDFVSWLSRAYHRETGGDVQIYVSRATEGGRVKRL